MSASCSASTKITADHRQRRACVYVRQSTVFQVLHHRESTERQYNLRQRARELGWAADTVVIIDEDQGQSGTSAEHRHGFQRLVAEVAAGEVGLVLMLEASRLARCGSDWHRLIEICSLTRTLIADEQSVYDAREPNDRLLLGVKGTLSEAELMTLRTRLYEGRWGSASDVDIDIIKYFIIKKLLIFISTSRTLPDAGTKRAKASWVVPSRPVTCAIPTDGGSKIRIAKSRSGWAMFLCCFSS